MKYEKIKQKPGFAPANTALFMIPHKDKMICTPAFLKKVFLFLPVLLMLFGTGYAQKDGYIVKGDTAYALGKIRFYPGMYKIVEFSAGKDKFETYNADQLSEFGYDDSTRYFSKQVYFQDKHQQVFLELLERGNVNLYRLHAPEETFFLGSDSLVLVKKDDLENHLKIYADSCERRKDQHKLVRYEKKSLSHYISNLNSGKCKPAPFISYGPVIRYTSSKISLSDASHPDNHWGSYSIKASDFYAGIFIEKPVWRVENLSIQSQLLFGKQKFYKEFISKDLNEDVIIEQSNLQLDVSPMYKLAVGKLRPYVFIGGSITYSLQSESYIFQAHKKVNVITFEKNHQAVNAGKLHYGFNLGAGTQYFYKYNKYIALEIGCASLYSSNGTSIFNNILSIKGNL